MKVYESLLEDFYFYFKFQNADKRHIVLHYLNVMFYCYHKLFITMLFFPLVPYGTCDEIYNSSSSTIVLVRYGTLPYCTLFKSWTTMIQSSRKWVLNYGTMYGSSCMNLSIVRTCSNNFYHTLKRSTYVSKECFLKKIPDMYGTNHTHIAANNLKGYRLTYVRHQRYNSITLWRSNSNIML